MSHTSKHLIRNRRIDFSTFIAQIRATQKVIKMSKQKDLKSKQEAATKLREEIRALKEIEKEKRNAIKALNEKKRAFREIEKKTFQILKGEANNTAKHDEKLHDIINEYYDLLVESLPEVKTKTKTKKQKSDG